MEAITQWIIFQKQAALFWQCYSSHHLPQCEMCLGVATCVYSQPNYRLNAHVAADNNYFNELWWVEV